MDPTISVSKGCFVFKNGATRASNTSNKGIKRKNVPESNVLSKSVTNQLFYKVFTQTWQQLQKDIEELQNNSYESTLEDIVTYIAKENMGSAETYGMEDIVPTAAIMTGINQSDHLEQFKTLSQCIQRKMSASVCILQSRDCSNLKTAIETMVYYFIEISQLPNDEEDWDKKRMRRSHCTMKQLKLWYRKKFSNNKLNENQHVTPTIDNSDNVGIESDLSSIGSAENLDQKHSLILILPDFECFNPSVLEDLILILSSYCSTLPFILVLGVATAVTAVHNALPYHVTRKIKLRVFETKAAPVSLNEILENVILSPKTAFHLSGKAFNFLIHIFLYYDFSINGFIQAYKYCLMEHFFQGNAYALCCSYTTSLMRIRALTHEDMETIRRMMSFRPYVEGINDCKQIIAILTDDDYLKKKLPLLLRKCHMHFLLMRIFLEFITVLVEDLPKCPLGKHRREIYATCLSKELVDQVEFQECWQMLSFMCKDEFMAKIEKAITVTERFLERIINDPELTIECEEVVLNKLDELKNLLKNVEFAGLENLTEQTKPNSPEQLKQFSSRQDLKNRLLQMSKEAKKPVSAFTKSVNEVLNFIQKEIVQCFLAPLERAPPLHELFVFKDMTTVRRNIIGAPRAALHTALNNPHFYLQCKCCTLTEQSRLLSTLPDICVAYKLHLECGRLINIFDWLQAFRSVVDYTDDDQEQVDPQVQARFTRAVAELQFLGFIKMSKRKTDHATRLTW